VLGAPPAGTVAAAAGVHAGDSVRAVDGEPISTWQELRWRVLQAALERKALALETLDERGHIAMLTLDLTGFPASDVEADALERVGLRLYRPPLAAVLGQIVSGGAAERAGLRSGDRVVRVDGQPIENWEAFVNAIRSHPATPLAITIERGGARETLQVVPDTVNAGNARIGRIGAGPQQPEGYAEKLVVRVRYGPFASLARAGAKTADIALFSLKMLGKMLIGQVSWRHLSGPVTIADFAGQ
jgi:regulator of sigma E protease